MVVPLPGRDVGAPGSLSVLLVEDMAPRRRPRLAPQPLWQEAHYTKSLKPAPRFITTAYLGWD